MSSVHTRSVLLLNADYQSLGQITIQKAFRLLAKGKAVVEEADTTKGYLRDWAYPKIVRLIDFVKINYKKLYGDPLFSKTGVLKRDHYKCCYCGRAAKTIDHVMPRSRGGPNTYMNTVAACFSCNNKKDNKTPKEANMKMRWQPYMPTKAQLMNRQ